MAYMVLNARDPRVKCPNFSHKVKQRYTFLISGKASKPFFCHIWLFNITQSSLTCGILTSAFWCSCVRQLDFCPYLLSASYHHNYISNLPRLRKVRRRDRQNFSFCTSQKLQVIQQPCHIIIITTIIIVIIIIDYPRSDQPKRLTSGGQPFARVRE